MPKLLIPAVLALLFCAETLVGQPVTSPVPTSEKRLLVNVGRVAQTIHSFGASDCWGAKFVGTWADEARKNQVADLLFSLDMLPTGQPKGIGLSLWRMNIGAGSLEQGADSNIGDEWRREACFQDAQGRYDWSKQAGNQWFLAAARRRGVRYTLGFTNSPPVHMTVNGRAFSPGGGSLNLKPDRLADFAEFLAEVSDHFQFDYVSPINEPQWDWKAGNNGRAGQEGSPAQNADILNLAKALSEKLAARKGKTAATMGETAQINFLYERAGSGRGNQLAELYASSRPSLGSLPHVAPVFGYHSYFSTCGDTLLVRTRQATARAARAAGNVPLWQTEFGVLGDICGKYNGSPRNTGIDYGLYVAKVIHHDLTIAGVTSWQWWLAINPYDYSDGLVYINGPDGQYKNHDNARQSGQVIDSKQLWAFGNYARFVRPGMKRIAVELPHNPDPVAQAGSYMVSGYVAEASRQLVLVAVNMTDQPVTLPLTGVALTANRLTAYVTDRDRNLAKSTQRGNRVTLAPRSVTTLVGNYR